MDRSEDGVGSSSSPVRTPVIRQARFWAGTALLSVILSVAGSSFGADGPQELAAGMAARGRVPPDLTTAQGHFERAAAEDDKGSAAEALFFLGEMDDAAFRFKKAMAEYEASSTRLPSSAFAPHANVRAHELRTHAEGDFAPLVRLEAVRRSSALSNDAAAIDALVRDAAGFPPGKVRVEARMLAAEAYLGRLARPEEALEVLRLVVDDPKADVLTARGAADELLRAYVSRNDLASALALTRRYPRLVEPTAQRDVLRLLRRRPLRGFAVSDLLLLAACAALSVVRKDRASVLRAVQRLAPMTLVFAAFASGVAGYLASLYEQTSPYPFVVMGPAMFTIALLARTWSAGGSPAPAARVVRAVVAFTSVFAAAFLVLDHMDAVYLQGFGL